MYEITDIDEAVQIITERLGGPATYEQLLDEIRLSEEQIAGSIFNAAFRKAVETGLIRFAFRYGERIPGGFNEYYVAAVSYTTDISTKY